MKTARFVSYFASPHLWLGLVFPFFVFPQVSFILDPIVGLEAHTRNIMDPDLRKRAASLPSLVMARWAPSTCDKYMRGWKKWESWCCLHPESSAIPARPFYICLYLNDLVLGRCKFGALDQTALGIWWGHLQRGLDNPMNNQ